MTNYKVTEHKNEKGPFYYILEAAEGHAFLDTRRPPVVDEEGVERYECPTAVGLTPEEYDAFDINYEVIPITENIVVY